MWSRPGRCCRPSTPASSCRVSTLKASSVVSAASSWLSESYDAASVAAPESGNDAIDVLRKGYGPPGRLACAHGETDHGIKAPHPKFRVKQLRHLHIVTDRRDLGSVVRRGFWGVAGGRGAPIMNSSRVIRNRASGVKRLSRSSSKSHSPA